MKRSLHFNRVAILALTVLIANLFFGAAAVAQSCGNNNIGFNSNTATDILTICSGTTGTTINGAVPAGSPSYQWQVSASQYGTYNNVSPDPGNVADWTIPSAYYNTPGNYYFRRVVSGSSGCDGNSDVARLIVKSNPVVTNNGGNSGSCAPTGFITLYGSYGSTNTYSLDGVTYQSGSTFNNLAAGTYTGYVKDSYGCIGTKSGIVITAAAALTITANPKPASSCAASGSIEIYRTGGVAPYTYSLDDITYQSSNTFTGLADGTYTGWVQDSKGCKASVAGVVVTKASAVTVSAVKSNTSVCSNTGAIQLYPGGGVPGYTYSLDDITYQSASLFTGLAAGTYSAWAKDTKGCKGTVTGIVVAVDPATVITVTSYAQNSGSCTSNGTISLYRSGGSGPFTYSLDDITYQSSNNFTGLAGGTYTGWVKDSKGCKGSQAGIAVAQDGPLTTTESHASASSCAIDGSIQLRPSGGSGTYTYSLDDITYQSAATFSSLPAGTYTGWVKDSRNCKASISITVSQAAAMVLSATTTAASSCVASNGTISLSKTGGVGPYTYSLNGVTYQSSSIFSSMAHGVYTAYIKDSRGCTGTKTDISVAPQDGTLAFTSGGATNAQSICNSAAIADISYTIGGSATGASATGLPAGVTGTFNAGVFTISGTPTAAGVYNYVVTTTGTCTQATANGTITVNAPPTASFTKTMASSCGGGVDGSITVTVSGGTAPYTYSWTGPGGYTASTAAITGLSTGDYTIIATDNKSCSVTVPSITIWQAQTPSMTFSGSQSGSCAASGSIVLYGSYGVAPYTYSIDGVTYQSSNTFNNVAAATYTGYVKDLRGCVGTKPGIAVTAAAPISVTASARTATSCAASNGQVQLFKTGGISPFSYSIDGSTYQTSPIFAGLPPGTYTGYVKDAKVCIGVKTNIVIGPGGCPRPAAKGSSAELVNEKVAVNNLFSVDVYPNPTATAFNVKLQGSSTEKVSITVTDITGRKVMETETNGKLYTFGKDLKPGMYYIVVVQGDQKQTIKLIKN